MLAVVEDEEESTLLERVDQHSEERVLPLIDDTEHERSSGGDEIVIEYRRQLDQPHAIGKLFQQLRRDLKGEARLSSAAGPSKRQEPAGCQAARNLRLLVDATDKARHLEREVRGYALRRAPMGHGWLDPCMGAAISHIGLAPFVPAAATICWRGATDMATPRSRPHDGPDPEASGYPSPDVCNRCATGRPPRAACY